MILLLASLPLVLVAPQANEAVPFAAPLTGPDLEFLVESTVLWSGRTAALPLRASGPAAADRRWDVTSADPSIVEVLGPALALADEDHAFVRVRSLAPGRTALSVAGRTLDVTVSPLDAEARVRRAEPAFVAPAQGACVWGTFTVGVELPPGVPGLDDVRVELVTGSGVVLAAPRVVEPDRGPERRYAFELDADALPEGLLALRARSVHAGEILESERLSLRVIHPAEGDVIRFEWEDSVGDERPEGFSPQEPSLAGDPSASGGRAVLVREFQPMPLLHVDVPAAGRWQAIARLRGDLGAGAFPTVALALDAPYTYPASVRVIDRRWHRLPVGPPIELGEGRHVLGLRLTNPIDAGRAERRRLVLDTLELVRAPAEAGGASGSMMSMTSMSMAGTASNVTDSARSAPAAGEHWLGVHTVFDGQPMNGRLMLEGLAAWSGGAAVAAPVTELVVDGEVLAATQTDEPIFTLSPAELGPGEHTVLLRSSQPGRGERQTPAQSLVVADAVERVPGRTEHRVTTLDEHWRLVGGEASPTDLAKPRGRVEGTIDLPAEWQGRFELRIDARGPGAPHAGTAHVRIDQWVDGEARTVGEDTKEIQNWWNERRIGELRLEAGPKTLTLTVEPDDSDARGADLLHVRSLVFRPVPEPDRAPPVATIVYPPAGHTAHGLDAVVVEAFDDTGLASVELLVDGRPAGAFARAPRGAGRIVLPFQAEEWSPGQHTLAVRVIDSASHECDSAEVPIVIAAEAPAEPGRFRRAVHLLDRLAWGPSTQDLAGLLALGEAAWLERAFERGAGDRAATELARASLADQLPYGAAQLALRAALMTDNPVRSRFVFFVDNHFSTWGGKTGMTSEYGDHLQWQALGFAPFTELLLANLTNPVMLVYLDQPLSFRGRLNENFARELLELHTVGARGGYDQADVTELAGLLTGLTVSEEAPLTGSGEYRRRVLRYAPDLASPAGADVMGLRFEALDGRSPRAGFERIERIAESLAAHPMTARYLAEKLAAYYVATPPPEDLVVDLERVFLESGGDPRELLRRIASHPAFWRTIDAPRFATPLDFALRLGRATSPRHVYGSLDSYLQEAGTGLFDHAAPDGYPTEDAAYVDSNALLSRWRVAQKFPWATRVLAPEEVRRSFGDGVEAWQRRAIEHASFALLGRRLGPGSTASAMEFMAELSEEPGWERVDQMTVLLTRLPEASLR